MRSCARRTAPCFQFPFCVALIAIVYTSPYLRRRGDKEENVSRMGFLSLLSSPQVYWSVALLFSVVHSMLQISTTLQRPNYAWSPSPPLPSPPFFSRGQARRSFGPRGARAGGETECAVIIQSEVSASQQGAICQGCRRCCKEQEKVRKDGSKEGRKEGSKGCWDGNGMGRVAPHAALSVTVSPSELDAEGVTVSECDDALSLSLLFTF